MSRWFRIYDDVLDDPKVQKLSGELFKTWMNLLCLASKGGGILPTIDDIAFRLRISAQDAQQRLDDLILLGLVDIRSDGKQEPHNWPTRQMPSDSSKDRMRKLRAKKRDGDVTSHVTDGDGHGDAPESESEKKRIDNLVPSVPVAARAKAKEQGLNKLTGMVKGKDGPISTLTKRAEGLGVDVDRIVAAVEEAKPDNYSAYFTKLCVNDLQGRLPGMPEQMIRDALWKKSPAAFTAITGALLMASERGQ